MSFDTPIYFVFLTLVVLVYWRLPWRGQNVLLLVASYFFYGWWDWRFLTLIAGSTLVDYWLGLVMSRIESRARRRFCLALSLVMNLGFLGFFKYFNFFIDSISRLGLALGYGGFSGPALKVILPVGISFYTFQAIAYIVDVYQRRIEPSRDLVSYALFISFFPHLVAGPIQRPGHLLPQTSGPRALDTQRIFDGLMLIVTGLFRKWVIADNCALVANAVFAGHFGEPSLAVVLLGVYAFAWQIYGDFSGYSDIARGSAQLLGFHFMVNFRQPYLATSLSELWQRWHISLSTWLRDYLYIPLGGNRRGSGRTYRNLLATMVLGGLWHGANWTFIVWGVIHGAGLALERCLRLRLRGRAESSGSEPSVAASPWKIWLRRIIIFHVVCFAWLFFRASSVTEAFELLGGLATWTWRPEFLTAFEFLLAFTVPMFLLDLLLEKTNTEYPFADLELSSERRSFAHRVAISSGLLLAVFLFGATEPSAFIYFQF